MHTSTAALLISVVLISIASFAFSLYSALHLPAGPAGPKGDQGIQGVQGIQGIQGIQGLQGLRGPQGLQGVPGAPGPALTIVGNYPNSQTFCATGPGSTTGELGIAWLMESDGSLFLWSSISSGICNGWYDAGDIQGPQGPQGVQGIQGIQGVAGPALTIVGNYPNSQTFCATGPGSTTGQFGVGWLIESDGNLFLWSNVSPGICNGWYDAGSIQGPQGPQGVQGPQGIQGLPGGTFAPSFASFYSSQSQYMGQVTTNRNVNVATPIKYDHLALSGATNDIRCSISTLATGGSVSGDSRIYIYTPGNYKLAYSIQFDQDVNQDNNVIIWYSKNGRNVDDSSSVVTLRGTNGKVFPYVEYLDTFSTGDYFEFYYQAAISSIHLAAYQSASTYQNTHTFPVGDPSIITNVYRIG